MGPERDDQPKDVSPLSPAGQVQQWGDLAFGVRTNPEGRRRALRMLAGLVVVLVVVVALT